MNPFLTNIPNFYPLEIPEKLWLSGVFRGIQMVTLFRNGLSHYDLTKVLLIQNLKAKFFVTIIMLYSKNNWNPSAFVWCGTCLVSQDF